MNTLKLLAQANSSNTGSTDAFVIFIAMSMMLLWLALFLWSLAWVYRDAEQRGKSGCLVLLIVLFFGWPLSLLLWLVFRPG